MSENAKRCCCLSFVCSRRFVFSYRNVNDNSIQSTVHLSSLLKDCNVSYAAFFFSFFINVFIFLRMEDFFKCMRQFLLMLQIPSPVSDQLMRIEVNWQTSKYLFERYKSNFSQFVCFEFPVSKFISSL